MSHPFRIFQRQNFDEEGADDKWKMSIFGMLWFLEYLGFIVEFSLAHVEPF